MPRKVQLYALTGAIFALMGVLVLILFQLEWGLFIASLVTLALLYVCNYARDSLLDDMARDEWEKS